MSKLLGNNSKKEAPELNEKSTKNIVFNVLSSFTYHFSNFNVEVHGCTEIALDVCQHYDLENERTHLILSEIESNVKHI